jgi:hypothetical protein
LPRYPDHGPPPLRGRATFEPGLFCHRLEPAEGRLGGRDAVPGGDVSLHRERPGPEVTWRQVARGQGGFSLELDTAAGDQPFLSLAIALPSGFRAMLGVTSLVFLDLACRVQAPVGMVARLNFAHQPNPDRIWSGDPQPASSARLGFELRHCQSDPARASAAWADVFFNNPGRNRITVDSLVLTCRPRAEF